MVEEEQQELTQVAPEVAVEVPVPVAAPAPKTVGYVIKQPVINDIPEQQEEPTEISLKDLIDDKFKEGRLSAKEIQRREMVKERRRSKNKQDTVVTPTVTTPVEVVQSSQPKLIMVNGKMVLDQESIQIRNQVQMHEGDIIEEDVCFWY